MEGIIDVGTIPGDSAIVMQVRAHVEAQIGLIAAGKADKAAVVEHTLRQFVQKFLFFSENISRMDALFEVNFSPLTASGSPLLHSQCVHASYNLIFRTSCHIYT
jgi:hypothetical protein